MVSHGVDVVRVRELSEGSFCLAVGWRGRFEV